MPLAIENLYYEFKSSFKNNPDHIIDFYAKNSILFNNTTSFKNKEELKLYIELIGIYTQAIYKKNQYNEVIDSVSKQLILINNEILRLKVDEIKTDWYYELFFIKAMASYNLHD